MKINVGLIIVVLMMMIGKCWACCEGKKVQMCTIYLSEEIELSGVDSVTEWFADGTYCSQGSMGYCNGPYPMEFPGIQAILDIGGEIVQSGTMLMVRDQEGNYGEQAARWYVIEYDGDREIAYLYGEAVNEPGMAQFQDGTYYDDALNDPGAQLIVIKKSEFEEHPFFQSRFELTNPTCILEIGNPISEEVHQVNFCAFEEDVDFIGALFLGGCALYWIGYVFNGVFFNPDGDNNVKDCYMDA